MLTSHCHGAEPLYPILPEDEIGTCSKCKEPATFQLECDVCPCDQDIRIIDKQHLCYECALELGVDYENSRTYY